MLRPKVLWLRFYFFVATVFIKCLCWRIYSSGTGQRTSGLSVSTSSLNLNCITMGSVESMVSISNKTPPHAMLPISALCPATQAPFTHYDPLFISFLAKPPFVGQYVSSMHSKL